MSKLKMVKESQIVHILIWHDIIVIYLPGMTMICSFDITQVLINLCNYSVVVMAPASYIT